MTTCKSAGCRRAWGYNCDTAPCVDPVTHRLIEAGGVEALICGEHAVAACDQLVDARLEPLTP
ncbi:hypothetical protein [Nonomuraea dietziae]|uniref:hypothetical protein n=1 Tax=Nonomuraea dietziae TaxID=65515 RepID=UPI0034336E31